MDLVREIRSRIGFFALFNLFDKVECNEAQLHQVGQAQRRHAIRLEQLERSILLLQINNQTYR